MLILIILFMHKNKLIKRILTTSLLLIFILILSLLNFKPYSFSAQSYMPFYALSPKNIILRSKFYTSYSTSSPERINNIKVASNAINKTLVDVGGEFSFNQTVGARTIERGYQTSKIIVGGEFIDGVGGGVCQVSTTLYNAVLLSGLKITEYHPHSLAVSYVAPSFDAMVSYGFADLKFINNTSNPILIFAKATDCTLTVEIYGEPPEFSYSRNSVFIEEIPPLKELEIVDIAGEYPELFFGQKKVIKYSKAGIKSEGYLIAHKNGRTINAVKLRSDTYSATRGIVIIGTTPLPNCENEIKQEN